MFDYGSLSTGPGVGKALVSPAADGEPGELEAMLAELEQWGPAFDEAALDELDGELLRTRAMLSGAAADRDQARAEAARARAQIRIERARAVGQRRRVLELSVEVEELQAELSRARGERDLARADLESLRAGTEGPIGDLTSRLAGEVPGPRLAHTIDALVGDPTSPTPSGPMPGLSDDQVVELVTACQRVASWATAAQLAAARHLRERFRAGSAAEDQGYWECVETLALACGVSRHAMDHLVSAAEQLPTRLPRIHRMLASGGLDWGKAKLVATKTRLLPDAVLAVIEDVLPREIAHLTQPQLTARLDQLLAETDPATHAEVVKAARVRRGVRFRALDHGLGSMTLVTGAEQIEAARAALNQLTLAARIAQSGHRSRPGLADPDNPHAPADPDGRLPAATRADVLIDLILGAGTTAPAAATPAPAKRAPAADIVVLMPLSVLTGASEAPATVVGYGPIPARYARELAAEGTWRCAAVDDRAGAPGHGTLLGLGTTRFTPNYAPGPRLREFVELRHLTCTFPGCRHPAARCDLDHRRPHDQGGATCDCTLHPLCRPHHLLKTHSRFTVRSDPQGTHWTTPTGRTYTTTAPRQRC